MLVLAEYYNSAASTPAKSAPRTTGFEVNLRLGLLDLDQFQLVPQAVAASIAISRRRSDSIAPLEFECFRVLPSKYSMTINAFPSVSPRSWIVQMFGWLRADGKADRLPHPAWRSASPPSRYELLPKMLLNLPLINLDHLAQLRYFPRLFSPVGGLHRPPIGGSSGPLFYQPDPLLLKCAKNSVRYQRF
jgi:hypothetical protein